MNTPDNAAGSDRPDALPLAGVRVLELGNFIAGPTAGRMLADFGAEVIKIERPETGDELRGWRLYSGTTSMLFHAINRGKKSVVLDLRSEVGRRAVVDIAATCDVVIENFRPGTLEKWGIGPEVLSARNPTLVITRISAFGQSGPMAHRPGFAAVAEAYGGLRELVGDPDRPPVRVGVSIGDSIAGLYGAFGAAMALFQRERTPQGVSLVGRTMDVALTESIMSMMESLVPDHCAYGVTRTRTGGRMQGIAPTNAYVCADGASVVIAGNSDSIFARYMAVIGRSDLGEDPDMATNEGRWRHRDMLDDAIGAWTATHTRDDVLRILAEADVPSGPIYTARDIVEDPQYRAREMVQYFPVDAGATDPTRVGFTGIVPVIGDRSLPIRSLAPELGEHTHEILGDLP